MAWTAADLANLEATIMKLNRRVAHGDKSVDRHSLAEMMKLRDQMQRELASTPRVYRARPSRG